MEKKTRMHSTTIVQCTFPPLFIVSLTYLRKFVDKVLQEPNVKTHLFANEMNEDIAFDRTRAIVVNHIVYIVSTLVQMVMWFVFPYNNWLSWTGLYVVVQVYLAIHHSKQGRLESAILILGGLFFVLYPTPHLVRGVVYSTLSASYFLDLIDKNLFVTHQRKLNGSVRRMLKGAHIVSFIVFWAYSFVDFYYHPNVLDSLCVPATFWLDCTLIEKSMNERKKRV